MIAVFGRNKIAASLAALCAVFLVAVIAWPRISSSAFVAGSMVGSQVAVGDVRTYGIGAASRDVDIRSVRVVFGADSAPATSLVSVCRQRTNTSIGSVAGWAEVHNYCRELVPAVGAHMQKDTIDGGENLVVTVVPLQPGLVVIERVEVTYRSGRHTRTDTTGPRIEMTVAAAP